MSQLIKQQAGGLMLAPARQAALATLDKGARKIIEAALSEPIKTANYALTVESLIDIITATYAKAGGKVAAEDSVIYAQEVYAVVVDKFPTCTLDEVRIAFNNGVYDEYGTYYGLYPKSFIHFIRCYMTSEERTKAREEFNSRTKLLAAPEKPKHDFEYAQPEFWTDDLKASWKEVTDKFYSYYVEGNMLYEATPEACYWLLQHSKRIKINDDYVAVLLKGAQERMRVETYQNKAKLPLDQIRGIIDAIGSGQDEDVNNQIRFIAKRIAVLNFFRGQKRKGVTQIFTSDQDEAKEV